LKKNYGDGRRRFEEETATVVIADDHPLFRKGLRDFVSTSGLYEIVGEASNGEEALDVIMKLKPDIAILDINMPGINGLDVARKVSARKLNTELIILTMYEDAEHFELAMETGIMGYVLKDSAAADVVSCIQSVLSGKSYISPSLSHLLMKRSVKSLKGIEKKLGVDNLTGSERKVLKLISEGKSTKDIADRLFISVKTVAAHRSNICGKLDLHGTNALLKFALEHKELL
jgi:DNA-binding NarL/FixJ family response regulator